MYIGRISNPAGAIGNGSHAEFGWEPNLAHSAELLALFICDVFIYQLFKDFERQAAFADHDIVKFFDVKLV